MKLASVYFDDTVCIPHGKDVGGGLTRQDLRDSCFHASDGWEIDEVREGVFSIWREGMPKPAPTVGGYGYTYVPRPLAAKITVERIEPWDAVGGMMNAMAESGDIDRMNAIADKLEAQGETPTAAMKQAIDAVIGPDHPSPPKRRKK